MLTPKELTSLKKQASTHDQRMVTVFNTLSDPNRCNLFRLVIKRPGINVSAAAEVLNLSVPLVSQHLKIMEVNSLLTKSKVGKEVHYQLNQSDKAVSAIASVIRA